MINATHGLPKISQGITAYLLRVAELPSSRNSFQQLYSHFSKNHLNSWCYFTTPNTYIQLVNDHKTYF